jgi:hypothetical protein
MIDGLGGLSGLSLFYARVSQKRKIKVKKAKAHKSTKTNSLDGTHSVIGDRRSPWRRPPGLVIGCLPRVDPIGTSWKKKGAGGRAKK